MQKLWEIEKDREAWCVAVNRVAELDTVERLNNNRQKPGLILPNYSL